MQSLHEDAPQEGTELELSEEIENEFRKATDPEGTISAHDIAWCELLLEVGQQLNVTLSKRTQHVASEANKNDTHLFFFM